MFPKRSKMYQRGALQFEGGYLIADRFFRVGCRSLDRLSHFFQNTLDILRKRLDVFIYRLKLLLGWHLLPFPEGDPATGFYPIRMPRNCPTIVPIMNSARLAAKIIPAISANWRMKCRPEIMVS